MIALLYKNEFKKQDKTLNEQMSSVSLININTVESHHSKIKLKVGVKNTAGLVKWALENEIV